MSNEREPREESEQKSSELAMVCVGLSKRQQRWRRARPDGRTDSEVRESATKKSESEFLGASTTFPQLAAFRRREERSRNTCT